MNRGRNWQSAKNTKLRTRDSSTPAVRLWSVVSPGFNALLLVNWNGYSHQCTALVVATDADGPVTTTQLFPDAGEPH